MLSSIARELAEALIRKRVAARRDATALEGALERALRATHDTHRGVFARHDIDDVRSFLSGAGATEIAKVLRVGSEPDARRMARAYGRALGAEDDAGQDLEAAFATLLGQLVDELGEHEPFADKLARAAATRARAAGAEDERELLAWTADHFSHVKTTGLGTVRHLQLPLADVFVMPSALRDRSAGQRWTTAAERQVALLRERLHSGEVAHEDFEAQLDRLELDRTLAPPEPIELGRALREHARLVVLGDPGSGKTTLLRYLALRHARALRDGASMVDATLGQARLPLYVRAGDFARSDGRDAGLAAYLAPFIAGRLGCDLAPATLSEVVARWLRSGRCLVLVDGLDEVGSAAERAGVVDAISSFAVAHGGRGNRIVCTSRISGYAAAALPAEFATIRLGELDDDAIERFLRLYVPQIERGEAPSKSDAVVAADATATVDALLEALAASPGVRRLAANPLLLTALLLVHRTRGRLPEHRVDAYTTVVGALADTWRAQQGVAPTLLPEPGRLMTWLSVLGGWMHEHRPEGSVSPKDLLRVLGPSWAELQREPWDDAVLDEADPESTVPGREIVAFVRQVEEHCGLLVERAPKRWGFAHLTFEEYFAGRALVKLGRTRDRPQRIRAKLHDPRWEEPILLGLGLVGGESPEEIDPLFQAAILARGDDADDLGFQPSEYEDLLGRDFRFALRALADAIPIAPALVDELLERAIEQQLGALGPATLPEYRQALLERLAAIAPVAAGARLTELVTRRLDEGAVPGGDVKARVRFVELAGRCRQQSEIDAALAAVARDGSPDEALAIGQAIPGHSELSTTVTQRLTNIATRDDSWAFQAAKMLAAHGELPTIVTQHFTNFVTSSNDDTTELLDHTAVLAAEVLATQGELPTTVTQHFTNFVTSSNDDTTELLDHIAVLAAEVLATQGELPTTVTQRLTNIATSKDSLLATMAARILATQGELPTTVTRHLTNLATTSNDIMAPRAAEVLARHGELSTTITQHLTNIATTSNGYTAPRAAEVLARHGELSTTITQHLTNIATTSNDDLAMTKAAEVLAARRDSLRADVARLAHAARDGRRAALLALWLLHERPH